MGGVYFLHRVVSVGQYHLRERMGENPDVFSSIAPTGLRLKAQGCRALAATLGNGREKFSTATRLCHLQPDESAKQAQPRCG